MGKSLYISLAMIDSSRGKRNAIRGPSVVSQPSLYVPFSANGAFRLMAWYVCSHLLMVEYQHASSQPGVRYRFFRIRYT